MWWRMGVLFQLAELLLECGRIPESGRHLRDTLRLATRMGDRQQTIYALAQVARMTGNRDSQSGLVASGSRLRRSRHAPWLVSGKGNGTATPSPFSSMPDRSSSVSESEGGASR